MVTGAIDTRQHVRRLRIHNQDDGTGGNSGDGNGNGDGGDDIPKDAAGLIKGLHAERAKAAEAKAAHAAALAELEELRTAQAAASKAKAEEDGKWQELYTEAGAKLEQVNAELEQLRTFKTTALDTAKARNATRLEALPEAVQEMAALVGDDPFALAKFLDKAEQALPELSTGGKRSSGLNGKPKPTPEAIEFANRHGQDVDKVMQLPRFKPNNAEA